MTRRRDMLLGGACVTAAGTAYALTPRHRVSLLGTNKLDDIVPRTFGDWTSVDMNDEVAPREEGSLASKLYGQTVGRLYTNAKTGVEVMMLLAWGDTQSNQLQVHRPEVCYPAFGYEIQQTRVRTLDFAPGLSMPARMLVVEKSSGSEWICYWTRLGEHFPITAAGQRASRFRDALSGVVTDGLLARFSTRSTVEPEPLLVKLIVDCVMAMDARTRRALIGSAGAAKLDTGGRTLAGGSMR
jgi:EpsI family protein